MRTLSMSGISMYRPAPPRCPRPRGGAGEGPRGAAPSTAAALIALNPTRATEECVAPEGTRVEPTSEKGTPRL